MKVATLTVLLGLSTPAFSDQVFNQQVILAETLLCVGFGCSFDEDEIPGFNGIRLEAGAVAIMFEDKSSSPSGNVDWRIAVNSSSVQENFHITDLEAGSNPFWIDGGAPASSVHVSSSGLIGLGTAFPLASLHLLQSGPANIRLESVGANPGGWMMESNSAGLTFQDTANSFARPLRLERFAPENAFVIKQSGAIGMGTNAPNGKLHTRGDEVQVVYF